MFTKILDFVLHFEKEFLPLSKHIFLFQKRFRNNIAAVSQSYFLLHNRYLSSIRELFTFWPFAENWIILTEPLGSNHLLKNWVVHSHYIRLIRSRIAEKTKKMKNIPNFMLNNILYYHFFRKNLLKKVIQLLI